MRLFDRTRAAWQGDLVHESVGVRGPVGRLRGELEHHPYADIADHLRKIDSYTTLWAQQARASGRSSNVVDMSAGASWAFFRNYVLKRGFLLGSAGFIISVLNTYYTFAKLAKLRELGPAARPEHERTQSVGCSSDRRGRAEAGAVLHVDTAASWRGGQNQVLLTASGMAARGVATLVACRSGGALETRARAAGLDVRPLPFRGDLWPPAIWALARLVRRERPVRAAAPRPARRLGRAAGRAALGRGAQRRGAASRLPAALRLLAPASTRPAPG